MWLILAHPEVATRNCAHCLKWLYDDRTGKVVQRAGQDIQRPPGTFAPCRTVGCPKGTPENSKALSARNRQAYDHYQECRAVGNFPDDPIVRRNAAIIRAVEDSFRNGKQDVLMARLGAMGAFLDAVKRT